MHTQLGVHKNFKTQRKYFSVEQFINLFQNSTGTGVEIFIFDISRPDTELDPELMLNYGFLVNQDQCDIFFLNDLIESLYKW